MWTKVHLPLLSFFLTLGVKSINTLEVDNNVSINLPTSYFSPQDDSTVSEIIEEDALNSESFSETLHFENTLNVSIEAGLKAMKHLYEVLEPEMLRNGIIN